MDSIGWFIFLVATELVGFYLWLHRSTRSDFFWGTITFQAEYSGIRFKLLSNAEDSNTICKVWETLRTSLNCRKKLKGTPVKMGGQIS